MFYREAYHVVRYRRPLAFLNRADWRTWCASPTESRAAGCVASRSSRRSSGNRSFPRDAMRIQTQSMRNKMETTAAPSESFRSGRASARVWTTCGCSSSCASPRHQKNHPRAKPLANKTKCEFSAQNYLQIVSRTETAETKMHLVAQHEVLLHRQLFELHRRSSCANSLYDQRLSPARAAGIL